MHQTNLLNHCGVSIKGGVPSKSNQKNVNKKYYYYIIFGITFFFFSIVQHYIRPNYDGGNSLIIYFLGVIPNFLPGIGLPSFIYVIIPDVFKPHSFFFKERLKFSNPTEILYSPN